MSGSARPGPTRRHFLAGTAALAAGGLALLGGSAAPSPAPSPALAPASGGGRALAQVLADADAAVGRRWLGSPWAAWAGGAPRPWSAVLVAWLLRGNGATPTDDPAAVHAAFRAAGRLGTEPRVGAVVLYSPGGTAPATATGLVTSVTGGVPQTVEGDHPFTVPAAERHVRRLARPGPGTVRYGYPVYGP